MKRWTVCPNLTGWHPLFYRKARLTPAQIETFESRLVSQWLDTLEVTPSGYNAGKLDLSRSELAAIFGPDGLHQWQEFERERVSDYFARNVALAIKHQKRAETSISSARVLPWNRPSICRTKV
jgi:hypothetical protein